MTKKILAANVGADDARLVDFWIDSIDQSSVDLQDDARLGMPAGEALKLLLRQCATDEQIEATYAGWFRLSE